MDTEGKRIHVVCGLIRNDQDQVLICKRSQGSLQGYWEFPGGKIENERAELALKRELREELGLEITGITLFMDSHHNYEEASILLTAYTCKAKSEITKMTDHDEVAWVSKKELLNYELAPADIPIAKAFSNSIV